MPTVQRFRGYRVMLYTHDHGPAHAHVPHAGKEAIFFLNCPQGPVSLRQNKDFLFSELRSIMQVLDQELKELCNAWEEIHVDVERIP